MSKQQTWLIHPQRECARGFERYWRPRKSEGAGKTGCALHPRSRRRCCTRIGYPRAYRFSGEHPASPTRWLYGLYVIVLVTGFVATIAGSRLSPLADLTPAPGRRTQTISPYAMPRSSFAASRPPLPAPRLRRRPTPLWWDRMAGVLLVICPTTQPKYFRILGLTLFLIIRSDLPVGLVCRRWRANIYLARGKERFLGVRR